MLINLVPEFLALLDAPDPTAAYRDYLDAHRPILAAYWRNYVLDPDGPHAEAVIRRTVEADRSDLQALLTAVDVERLAEAALATAQDLLRVDRPTDLVLMIGVGAANAGELVVDGRGVAFLCLEHFTGRANAETLGLGLAPSLMAPWIAHEIAHTVRYTSPASASEMRRMVAEAGGYYDYWDTGSRVPLRELLLNEGLAVHAASAVAPGLDPAEYFGYSRRQYHRLRELEAFLRHVVEPDLDHTGLGLRLRYLMGGTSPAVRLVAGRVLPERAGYYLGHRMAEALVHGRGIAEALRAPAEAFRAAEEAERGIQTA